MASPMHTHVSKRYVDTSLSLFILALIQAVTGVDAILITCPSVLSDTCFKNKGYRFPAGVTTKQNCCDACVSDQLCGAWTFVGGTNEPCHLKHTAKNKTTCAAGVSGVVRSIPPTPPPPPPPMPPMPPTGTLSVLFIVVDDLRPELNQAYGQSALVTPNLDNFASSSLTFNRGYVQYSHCSPSRNSFLSGRSPQTTAVYNFIDSFRELGQNWTSLPQFFKEHGFYTSGGGKVFHPGHPENNDQPLSWTNYFFANGDDGGCRTNETIYNNVCPSKEPDNAFYDNILAHKTVTELTLAKTMSPRPFFIAAGLRRPHRVWHVPKRFYDLYENNGSAPTNMRLAKHKLGPVGMPELAYIDNAWPSFKYDQFDPIPDNIAALGRWGYYAAVSFTDFNIGIILAALDDLKLANNTIVVVIGDHGWQLGEHGEWCKRTNFELGVRIPYMIRSPHHTLTHGKHTNHFAEALDLYRTLAGLTGLGNTSVEAGVEGSDLSPIFANPNTVLKTSAFSQMARCPSRTTLGPESACNSVKLDDISYMGYSVRTDEWRYTVWLNFSGSLNRATCPQEPMYVELYDHTNDDGTDFDRFENINMVTNGSTASVRAQLLTMLRSRFHFL